MTIINGVLLVLGVLSGWLLFMRLRFLKQNQPANATPFQISVVIPARNEADTLPGLLSDLAAQDYPLHEIICVDDASDDATAQTATRYGAQVLRLEEKPAGWLGKSYACHRGAQRASGTTLLFLDADVRLAPDGVRTLINNLHHSGGVLSVQPKHITEKWYEQLSLFFNLIAAAALGADIPFAKRTAGVFGPVILLPKAVYVETGGYEAVKGSILDDISLGRNLEEHGVQPCTCLGGNTIRFRMYPQGLASLREGWTKNFATGAAKSTASFFVFIALWVAALCRVPMQLVASLVRANAAAALLYGAVYGLLVVLLYTAARKVGRFKPLAICLYPVCLVYFVWIFLCSLYKKIFNKPVRWKGRDITLED